jgi:ribosomal protein S18 acetylase RimI-like enzyme
MTIEPARTTDFLSIAALDRIAWGDETFIVDGEHIWRVWCEYATLLVARQPAGAPQLTHSGDIAGAVVMFPTKTTELVLHKIMVHPDCRGQGIGSDLMRAALAEATADVLLTVNPQNATAVKLYENFGYRIREHVEGFYRPHEHRYVMVYEAGGKK